MLNRAGVEAMKLTPQTKAPEGGRFEFVEGGGALLHAEPRPIILYQAVGKLPPMSPEEQVNSNLHWYRELNRFGLTSVVDAGGGGHAFPEGLRIGRRARQTEQDPAAHLDVSLRADGRDGAAGLREVDDGGEAELQPRDGAAERLRVRGRGENLVHSAGDYENFMAPPPELSDEKLRSELTAVTTLLVRNGWPIRIHATYDQTITKVLDVFEQVFKAENFKGRWIIDHAEGISDRNIARVKRSAAASPCRIGWPSPANTTPSATGKRRLRHAPPLRKLLDSGVPIGAGTDLTRVSSYNPWLSLYWMVSGKTVGGTELYPQGEPPHARRGAAVVHARQRVVQRRRSHQGPDRAGPARRFRRPLGGLHVRARGADQEHRIGAHRARRRRGLRRQAVRRLCSAAAPGCHSRLVAGRAFRRLSATTFLGTEATMTVSVY